MTQVRGSALRAITVGAAVLTIAISASAQSANAQPADRKAVQDAVEAFLLHLGDHEFDKVAGDFTPKAIIAVVRERNGEWSSNYQTGEEWVATLQKNPNPTTFREPISNVQVTIDSDRLAYLRADFQVVREGKTLSHGVDQFTLVRESAGWKIAAIAYTSIPVH
jgi:SnoaL-like domain